MNLGDEQWFKIVTVNMGYASCQIAVAMFCVTIVCFAGIETNESARRFIIVQCTNEIADTPCQPLFADERTKRHWTR